jgi:hypothetical protein
MTIEYAKAYSRERIAHAEMKRRQREALAGGPRPGHPIRNTVGRLLIAFGERLSSIPRGEGSGDLAQTGSAGR